MTDEAAMLYHPGMRRTLRIGSLGLIELAVRLGDHPQRPESIADAVVVTDALGQVQGFIRRRFCTTLHLAVAHHRSTYAIEELDAEREWRCGLSLLPPAATSPGATTTASDASSFQAPAGAAGAREQRCCSSVSSS